MAAPDTPAYAYDGDLGQIIDDALSRLDAELRRAGPVAFDYASRWIGSLFADREQFLTHPTAFPVLLLPWWLGHTIHDRIDRDFQAELAYSTINGYYHIRLADNLLDRDAPVDPVLVPLLGFFHYQFLSPYLRIFGRDDEFWAYLSRTAYTSTEVTMNDAILVDIDEKKFKEICAKKSCGGKIPLAAVCYRSNRADLIEPWTKLFDLLARWYQMVNDTADWSKDSAHGNATYFLSEAARRRGPEEPLIGWVLREGLDWSTGLLRSWMEEMREVASGLDSPQLEAFLTLRHSLQEDRQKVHRRGLEALGEIATSLAR